MLTAHHVPDLEAPANFSLFVAPEPETRGPRELHVLYRSRQAVARSRNAQELVHSLLHHLASFVEPEPDGRLRLDVCVAAGEAGVILLPGASRRELAELDAALRRRRVSLLGLAGAEIDVHSGELLVPDPRSVLRLEGFDELGDPGALGRLRPGRYPVAGWALPAPGLDELTRARAVAFAVRAVDNVSAVGARAVLEGLGRLFSSAVAIPVPSWHAGDVARGIAELVPRAA